MGFLAAVPVVVAAATMVVNQTRFVRTNGAEKSWSAFNYSGEQLYICTGTTRPVTGFSWDVQILTRLYSMIVIPQFHSVLSIRVRANSKIDVDHVLDSSATYMCMHFSPRILTAVDTWLGSLDEQTLELMLSLLQLLRRHNDRERFWFLHVPK